MGIISNLLFGDNQNKMSYKDAAIKKHYSDISNATYDSMYGGMQDYLDKNYEGGASKYKYDFLSGVREDADNAVKQYGKDRYNVFGNGIIGSLLNPIVQTGGALGDLTILAGTGGRDNKWAGDSIGYKRDIGSDLGALGETALTVFPTVKGLSLAKAGKAMRAGTATTKQAAKVAASQAPKTLGQKVVSGALVGGAYGAAGGLRDMGFENFDPGQLALSTAIGGALGGGVSAAGYGVNKLASRAQATRDLSNMYQQYLAEQNPNALSIPSSNAQPSSQEWLLNRGKLARTKLGQAIQGIGDTISYKNMMGNGLGSKAKNIANKATRSRVGTNVSNLLKTKKGKIGLGIGGGLLLSQILGGRNQNQNNMTDEELYNYIVKGEQ